MTNYPTSLDNNNNFPDIILGNPLFAGFDTIESDITEIICNTNTVQVFTGSGNVNFTFSTSGSIFNITKIILIPANTVTSISGDSNLDPNSENFLDFIPTSGYIIITSYLPPGLVICTGRGVNYS